MPDFRSHTPKRRLITRSVNSHRDHKNDLKTDFQSRCGYCNSPDVWKISYYEVDHFIPLAILTIKHPTDYSNLVYACRSCNNSKRKQWPTNDETVPNRNDQGFIDPCDDDFNNHFLRKDNGEIMYRTKLGEWMYFAMRLHKPQHSIIWNLECLEHLIDEIEKLNVNLNDNQVLQTALLSIYRKYRDYNKQFRSL